ncbi:MAG: hypothetical protein H6705_01785 [Myxococcales bacterium]|nr:hypothetical protein [Myxococcales bacterium]
MKRAVLGVLVLGLAGAGCEADEDATRADPVEDAARPAPDRSIPLDGLVADGGPDGAVDMAGPDVAVDVAVSDMASDMSPDGMAADMALADMASPDMASPDMALPDMGECAGEGESVPVVPNAPPCCEGLEAISCDRPGPDGVCMEGCAGAVICADCGDGRCGPGENACNCALDCGAVCRSTGECVDHPAPIRCVGLWRCDPDQSYPADARGDDGCDYTCIFNHPACDGDGDCAPPDVCLPCPIDGECDGRAGVCGDPANVR